MFLNILDNKSKLSVYCSYENFEDALQLQATKLNSLRDQKGLFTYEKIAYKKYLEKVDDSKACCPLCTRDFSNKNEIQEFKRKVKVKMDQNPDAAKSCEAELKKEEAKYDAMLQLKPLSTRILEFEQYELKELKYVLFIFYIVIKIYCLFKWWMKIKIIIYIY